MTSDYFKAKVGGAILSLSMLFGVALIAGTTTQAQYPQYPQYPSGQDRQIRRDRNGDRDRDRDYRNGRGGNGNSYRYAEEQGYRDGLYTGESDAQRRQSYNPQRSHFYRSGGDGSSYGRDQQAFRNGFLRGYDEGYRRYRGNNRGNNRGRGGRWFPF